MCCVQDRQMRMMADVQLNTVTEWRSRQAIGQQIVQWTAKLERHVIEQFQLRCYVAALQATELPNPKVRINGTVTTNHILAAF